MKGRTEENIRASMEKMHKIAELICGEELEVIDSYIEHKPPENSQQSIWYLGESIKSWQRQMYTSDYRGLIPFGMGAMSNAKLRSVTA